MPRYNFHLCGGPGDPPPLHFDLSDDDSAVALSICVLRDQDTHAQVWILDGDETVALRVRRAGSELGVLIRLRD